MSDKLQFVVDLGHRLPACDLRTAQAGSLCYIADFICHKAIEYGVFVVEQRRRAEAGRKWNQGETGFGPDK